MARLDPELLRKIAGWETNGVPVTSLLLDVDGRRWPKRADYIRRAEDLTDRVCREAEAMGKEAHRSACHDKKRVDSFVRHEFERSRRVRGLAAFSCSGAGLWEAVTLSRPLRDRAVLAPRPYLLPLESMVELSETFCTVIVDRARARIFLSRLGEIEERSGILDEVPGRHDQGGWSQARLQRHIEDHVQRHLKRVAEALLRLQRARPFDHLVLAGPEEAVAELERELHDYVSRRVLARTSLPIQTGADEVLERTMQLERGLEDRREREAVERLASEARAGTGRAVAGMGETLSVLEENRADALVVLAGLRATGVRCTSCGHLDTAGKRCVVCRSPVEEVPDLVEVAVEEALRRRCRVETVESSADLERLGGIGALLRF
jgi:peptide chain release factor subunit 1